MPVQAVKNVSLKGAAIALTLLESDLEFHSICTPKDDSLEFYGGEGGPGDTALGSLEIWWGCVLEARDYGIKGISVYVRRVVLDGHFEDEVGQDRELPFHYEWPEVSKDYEIGDDVDAPTPGNLEFLSTPKWTLKYRLLDTELRESFAIIPTATVDLTRRKIEIEF